MSFINCHSFLGVHNLAIEYYFSMKPEEMRSTVDNLTWKIQMQRVLYAVFLCFLCSLKVYLYLCRN